MERFLRVAAVLLTSLLLLAAPGWGSEEDPIFEIVVLGTHHAPGMFQGSTYTPAHIRATLALAKPDVVAVESHPDWFAVGRYHVVTYEAEGVAVPFAKKRGLPVYGVDHKDIEDWDRGAEQGTIREVQTLRRALTAGSRLPPFWFGGRMRGAPAIRWEHINSEEYGKSRYRGKSPDDEDFAVPRDRGIARNCVEVMKKHAGKRLAVVIGAHHKPYLEILLRKRGDVKVLRLGEDVPFPTAKQIAAAWTTQDLLAVLGHQFDAGGGPLTAADLDLARMQELLGMLEQRRELPEAARYYRARILHLEGKPAEAEALLDGLRSSQASLYPFPMRNWRMRYTLSEAARVEQARLLLARKETAQAKVLLDEVAAALDARLGALEKSHVPVKRTILALKDPGFEAGKRAGDIFAGWDTYLPSGHGLLRFAGDEKTKTEGSRSLRIDVVESNPRGYGFVVRQAARIAPPLFGAKMFTFGLALKGERVGSATLQVGPSWSSQRREPYASQTVDLSAGAWTRAEVSCPLPPRGEFYVKVTFDGPTGAHLWLDDGTRVPIEYETLPDEWTRLTLAARYPRWLLGGPKPEGGPTALRDPGFEGDALAGSPLLGWYCDHARNGKVRAGPDPSVKTQGDRSLRAELVRVPGVGKCSISQIVSVLKGQPVQFSVALRSNVAEVIVLLVMEFAAEGRAVVLESKELSLKPNTWSRHALEFRKSTKSGRVAIQVYLPSTKGATLWLDDARLAVVK